MPLHRILSTHTPTWTPIRIPSLSNSYYICHLGVELEIESTTCAGVSPNGVSGCSPSFLPNLLTIFFLLMIPYGVWGEAYVYSNPVHSSSCYTNWIAGSLSHPIVATVCLYTDDWLYVQTSKLTDTEFALHVTVRAAVALFPAQLFVAYCPPQLFALHWLWQTNYPFTLHKKQPK